jgi:hypothetical protein
VALPLNNNAEGGTNTTVVTTGPGNSGGASGDAFDAASGANKTFDNAHPAHGALAYKFVWSAAAENSLSWVASIGTPTDIYGRCYFYLPALPTSGQYASFVILDLPGTGVVAAIGVTDAGKIILFDAGGGNTQGTFTVTAGAVHRLEFHVTCNATTGLVETKYFASADGTAADETVNWPNRNTRTSMGAVKWGFDGSGLPASFEMHLDDLNVNGSAYPGPVGGQTVAPTADISAGAWTPSAGGSLFATIDENPFSDSDYDQSGLSPASADEMKVRLAPLVDPAVGTGHNVSYRYKKNATGGDRIDLTVTLYAANGTTVIKSWTHTNIDAVTSQTQTLTGTEADSIPSADYATGLVLGFSAIKV